MFALVPHHLSLIPLFSLLFGDFKYVFLLSLILLKKVKRVEFAFSVLFNFGKQLSLFFGPLKCNFNLDFLSIFLEFSEFLNLNCFFLANLLFQYFSFHLQEQKSVGNPEYNITLSCYLQHVVIRFGHLSKVIIWSFGRDPQSLQPCQSFNDSTLRLPIEECFSLKIIHNVVTRSFNLIFWDDFFFVFEDVFNDTTDVC